MNGTEMWMNGMHVMNGIKVCMLVRGINDQQFGSKGAFHLGEVR